MLRILHLILLALAINAQVQTPICPLNYVFQNGMCMPLSVSTVTLCPQGYVYQSGACVKPPTYIPTVTQPYQNYPQTSYQNAKLTPSVPCNNPLVTPCATASPCTPAVTPCATSSPCTPAVTPCATSTPCTPAVTPCATSTPCTPAVTPCATSNPVAPITPCATSTPCTPAVTPCATSNPVTPITPCATSTPCTPAVTPCATPVTPITPCATPVTPITPCATSTPLTPCTTPIPCNVPPLVYPTYTTPTTTTTTTTTSTTQAPPPQTTTMTTTTERPQKPKTPPPDSLTKPTCPPGTKFIANACRIIYCSFGVYRDNRCIQVECPAGSVWNGIKCILPEIQVHDIVFNTNITTNSNNTDALVLNNINNLNVNATVQLNQTSENYNYEFEREINEVELEHEEEEKVETIKNCCTVQGPRMCQETGKKWKCWNKRFQRCGSICQHKRTVILKPPSTEQQCQQRYNDDIIIMSPDMNFDDCGAETGGCYNAAADYYDCSGCSARNSRHCSSYCYTNRCGTRNCAYHDQRQYCNMYPGESGCQPADGCYADWCGY